MTKESLGHVRSCSQRRHSNLLFGGSVHHGEEVSHWKEGEHHTSQFHSQDMLKYLNLCQGCFDMVVNLCSLALSVGRCAIFAEAIPYRDQ